VTYEFERRIAIESVLKACRLCRTVQSTFGSRGVIGKKDGSPVTIADFGAQALISSHLMIYFPEDPLVAEENAQLLRQKKNAKLKETVISHVTDISPDMTEGQIIEAIDRGSGTGDPEGRFWVLDPIDGTKGFLREDQYAVALALVDRGRVVLGLLGCPHLLWHNGDGHGVRGCLFAAVKGEGSAMRRLNDPVEHRIEVTHLADPSQALLCESLESSHASHEDTAKVAQYLGLKIPPLHMDSQCKYGIVARGEASIYLRLPSQTSYREKIWDHAAGSIIVEEAGGRVTDLKGNPLDFSVGRQLLNNRGIVATNERLHDLVLEAAQKVLA
jgi:3'(2'), 5'-bisphosphate nucleotidase